jgi:hypothetical protein
MTGSGPVTLERRAHPRVPHRSPVDVVADGQSTPIAASTVDVSFGGMRITSTDPVPVGPCTVVFGSVAFVGEVLGQILDLDSGLFTSRIRFAEVSPAARDHLAVVTATTAPAMAPPAAAVAAVPTRRFYAGIVAAAVLVMAIVAVALVVRAGGSDEDASDATSLASTSEDVEEDETSSSASESGSDDPAEPASTPTTAAPSPSAEDPSTDPAPAVDPAPAPTGSDPAPAPAPALVTRTETADNGVQVELSEDPSQTAVASTVGPSAGVDKVRIQLDVIPEQQGTVLPVAVVIENRGDRDLEFADGLTTTITVTGADGAAHDVVLRAPDVTTLAPGARHELLGSIDFGGYGRFDVTASTPVGERG